MITVRAGPRMSVIAGPICRTQYMFMKMCSSDACSQPALSTVHQRPNVNTGIAPLAPNRNSTGVLGASIDMMPLTWKIALPDISSVTTYNVTHAPITTLPKPKSAPIAQRRTEAPQAGIGAAARVALVIAHADERAARRADD